MPAFTGLPHRGKCAPGGIYQTQFPKPRSSFSVPTSPVQAILGVTPGTAGAIVEALKGVAKVNGPQWVASIRTPDVSGAQPSYYVTMPVEAQVGDLVIVHVGFVNGSNSNFDSSVPAPAGWTQLVGHRADLGWEYVHYRIIDGSEGAAVLFSINGSFPASNRITTHATAYRGVNQTTPISGTVSGGSSTPSASSITTSAVTMGSGSSLLVMLAELQGNGATATGYPKNGVKTRYDVTGAGSNHVTMRERLMPPGAYTMTITFSSMENVWCAFSINPSEGTPQIEAIQVLRKLKDSVYARNVLKNNPYLYYRVEEDGTDIYNVALDSSGNARNAAYSSPGVTYHATALISDGYAVTFDGSSYINYGSLVVPVGSQIMLEAWIKTSVGSGEIWSSRDHNQTRCFAFGLNGAGKIQVLFWDSGGTNHGFIVGVTNVADNLPHHVVATFDGTTQRLYVDGVEDKATVDVFTLQAGSIGNVQLGAFLDFGVFSGGLNGTVDEAAIYFNVDGATPGKIKERFLAAQQNALLAVESLGTVQKVGSADPSEALTSLARTILAPAEANQGIASTLLEPLDALKALAVLAATVDESQRLITATSLERLEALVALAASSGASIEATAVAVAVCAEIVEALGGLARTAGEPLEAVSPIIASTISAFLEALQGIGRTTGANIDSTSSVPVSQTAALILESLRGIAGTGQARLDATGPVSASVASVGEALASVLASATERAEVLLGIASTSAAPAEARGTVAAAATEPLDIASRVAATVQAITEALRSVSATRLLPAEELQRVAATVSAFLEAVEGHVVSNTVVAALESLQGIRATEVAVLDATRRLAAATAPLPAETIRPVAAIATLIAEAGVGVSAVTSVEAETLQTLAKLAGAPLDATGFIRQVATGHAETLLPVGASSGLLEIEALGFVVGQLLLVRFEALQTVVAIGYFPGDDPPVVGQVDGGALAVIFVSGEAVAGSASTLKAVPAVVTEGSAERRPQ